jgi:methylated-DNA-[protein]-cysteine S-methyltransferase
MSPPRLALPLACPDSMKHSRFYTEFPSPVGTLRLRGTAGALRGLCLAEHADRSPLHTEATRDDSLFRTAREQVEEFLSGQRRAFSIPIELTGTPFQVRVWRELLSIPYGETRGYAQIAETIGAHRASRAVGSANRCNPLLILVPCHRVIAADGSLSGYQGGVETKKFLLALERNTSTQSSHHILPTQVPIAHTDMRTQQQTGLGAVDNQNRNPLVRG